MKTLKKIALILCATLLTSSAIYAMPKDTNPNPKKVNETENTIRSYFKFPQLLIPYYEQKKAVPHKIEVLFTTDTTGKVNFVLAKTRDEVLKQEIENQFSKLYLNKLKQNTVHSVVLNFSII